jgi:predicted metal-dependent HD superfamily phosphohydrolase
MTNNKQYIHTAAYFNKLQQYLGNGRHYRKTEHIKTRIRITKTARVEVLHDEVYSTLDGDINMSTVIRGVTNITYTTKCEF